MELADSIRKKIDRAVSKIEPRENSLILYHTSKAGLQGPIAPISRAHCDFGKGFYMGAEPDQPLTLLSDYAQSRLYIVRLDLTGLRVLELAPDLRWAMLVTYNRGKLEQARGAKLYRCLADMTKSYDVIVGGIADDAISYVLDNFALGMITHKALVMSLSELGPAVQYVAITQKACDQVRIEAEIPLSAMDKSQA